MARHIGIGRKCTTGYSDHKKMVTKDVLHHDDFHCCHPITTSNKITIATKIPPPLPSLTHPLQWYYGLVWSDLLFLPCHFVTWLLSWDKQERGILAMVSWCNTNYYPSFPLQFISLNILFKFVSESSWVISPSWLEYVSLENEFHWTINIYSLSDIKKIVVFGCSRCRIKLYNNQRITLQKGRAISWKKNHKKQQLTK